MLIGNISEDGTRSDDIHRSVGNNFEIFGRTLEKGALVFDIALNSQPLRVLQHRSRNIGEQDVERMANALNGAEGDQAIPGTYIGKNHIGSEPGAIENAIGI